MMCFTPLSERSGISIIYNICVALSQTCSMTISPWFSQYKVARHCIVQEVAHCPSKGIYKEQIFFILYLDFFFYFHLLTKNQLSQLFYAFDWLGNIIVWFALTKRKSKKSYKMTSAKNISLSISLTIPMKYQLNETIGKTIIIFIKE